jgi:hypothetical protein
MINHSLNDERIANGDLSLPVSIEEADSFRKRVKETLGYERE